MKNKKNILKKIKIPKNIPYLKIKNFFRKKKLEVLIKLSRQKKLKINQLINKSFIRPELIDLYRLYQFVILNKRTTVLEFGSGYSSLIFALALNELNTLYKNKIIKLRRNDPFKLFIVENSKKYLNNTKKLIKNFSKKLKFNSNINYHFSNVKMTTFKDCISTSYEKLPSCNPDFIYLDGPDQFNVKRKVNNITTAHRDMMPMANDILKIENFLTPGTIIIVDGRGANAQFLKNNFRRHWLYKNDERNDQHIFYLNAQPLGKYNKLQLEFYKS
jgi:hypothetical protein